MTQTLHLEALLADAAARRCILLSNLELARCEHLSIGELKRKLRKMETQNDDRHERASRQILDSALATDLGHAPAWIDSGTIFEELVAGLSPFGSLDTIFCLDPWAAQLRSRTRSIASDAKWIFVSDIARRKGEGNREYWEQMESWVDSLSFYAVIPQDKWDAEINREGVKDATLHLEKPGAWQWKRILPPTAGSVHFLVSYSGSVMHLRVFLDSLARQNAVKGSLQCTILRGQGGEDPGGYTRWFELAHPEIRITSIRTENEPIWKEELNRRLERSLGATLVLIGDHAILPDRFVQGCSQNAQSSVIGVPLSVEASAHIVTGNLDPIPNYESLLRASLGQGQGGDSECARILAPDSWMSKEEDYASGIFGLTKGIPPGAKSSRMHVLQLGDLR